jgi:MFS transporter, PHS family, inorganic phosphate transporter
VVDQVWRWTVGVGMIPATIAVLFRLTIPETPRYYAYIRENLRKGVKNALKIYKRDKKGRTFKLQDVDTTNSAPSRRNRDEDEANDNWYAGVWAYLIKSRKYPIGPRKPGRPGKDLILISLIWGVMDITWYGLTMDSAGALSTLAYNPSDNSSSYNFGVSQPFAKRSINSTCADSSLWNTDFWDPSNTIYDMLQENALRSIIVDSIASVTGSVVCIAIINYFHRKTILVVTFLLVSLLFVVAGSSLIVTSADKEGHITATVFYASLQFIYNVAPNPLMFVLASEIFPTVYRGTFFGIASASGKVGAIIIRAIIGATGNQEMSLGIRLLVFAPMMVLAAVISWFLPKVQDRTNIHTRTTELEQNTQRNIVSTATEPEQNTQEKIVATSMDLERNTQEEEDSRSSNLSQNLPETANKSPIPRFSIWGRLRNTPLEIIAPNPFWKSVIYSEETPSEKEKGKSGGQVSGEANEHPAMMTGAA